MTEKGNSVIKSKSIYVLIIVSAVQCGIYSINLTFFFKERKR